MRSAVGKSIGSALLAISAAAFVLGDPPAAGSSTSPLRWKSTSIKLAVSSSVTSPNPNIKAGTDVRDVVRRSLATWENISNIKLIESSSDKQSVSPSGVSGDGLSLLTIAQTPENLALFQNNWQTSSARTRVFYNRRHEITEADIVLNPYAQFSDDGTLGTFDLESTLTHEIGHLLGLEHSFSFGSAMYASFGKNGIFGLQSRRIRNLSPEDVSALYAIYGSPADDESCCGQITGRLSGSTGRSTAEVQVWAENTETGEVVACSTSGKGGVYRIEGLPAGIFSVYAQERGLRASGSALKVGDVEVERGKTTFLNANLPVSKAEFDLRYLGINSQLADAAIPVNAGRTYLVYFGGTDLDAARITLGSNSPWISVSAASVENVDFSDRVSVVRAEVTIDAKAPPGDYSLFVEANGVTRYIVGGIAVQTFVDPWDFAPGATTFVRTAD